MVHIDYDFKLLIIAILDLSDFLYIPNKVRNKLIQINENVTNIGLLYNLFPTWLSGRIAYPGCKLLLHPGLCIKEAKNCIYVPGYYQIGIMTS